MVQPARLEEENDPLSFSLSPLSASSPLSALRSVSALRSAPVSLLCLLFVMEDLPLRPPLQALQLLPLL